MEEVTEEQATTETCQCQQQDSQEEQTCQCGHEDHPCSDCNCMEEKQGKKEKKEKHKRHKKELEEKEQQLALLQEQCLRTQAEFQNYKRRREEETQRLLKYSNEDLVKALLDVVDNFEMAIKLDDNDLSDELSKFLAGFKLIYGKLNEILDQFEVKEIEALGKPFDPTYHQAVLMDQDENFGKDEVIEVLQKGYTYKDKVIRPVMVKVNK